MAFPARKDHVVTKAPEAMLVRLASAVERVTEAIRANKVYPAWTLLVHLARMDCLFLVAAGDHPRLVLL